VAARQQLRQLREQAGITVRAAAMEIERSNATMSKIESGKQVGCLVYVKLLTAMYGVDPRPGKADRTARGG
jgi:transcriptional regulator with XRE-family HTH domain